MSTIRTVHDEMREANDRLHAIVAAARKDDRELSPEEDKESGELVAKMKALDAKRLRAESFDDLLKSVSGLKAPAAAAPMPASGTITRIPSEAPAANGGVRSFGEQFVSTDMYAQLRAMPKTGQWATPVIELQAAVTVEPPGTLVPGGTMILPFLPYPTDWGVAGLFAPGTLDGGMVQYLRETVWTNAAAVVAVGGTKPESTKTFALVQQGLVKIAHWIPVPDEFLEDISGLRSFIDAQMRNGVVEELNDQLVNGSGTGGNMLGLIALTGKAPDITAGAGAGAGAQAIAAQAAQVYALSRLRPDAVVMNPKTWAGVSSELSASGGFIAGLNTFAQGAPATVWGLRVVTAPEVADGTAIVGAYRQGGQLYTKGGVSVQATNSHDDFFIKNITAIRAEVRAALVIYRPQAFGLVLGLPIIPPVGP
jgi:HK97 family phage major capsid protein